MSKKLTEKQRKFVEAYMGEANGNATLAAKIAGYNGNDKQLQVIGSQNLSKLMIMNAIHSRQENDPLVLSREQRQQLLTRIANGEEHEQYVSKEGDIETTPTKMADRLKAIDQLNKMGADYTENRKLTGELSTTPVIIEIPSNSKAVQSYNTDNTQTSSWATDSILSN